MSKRVYVLMTKWRDDDPEVAGVFSSFDKAASYFVRVMFRDSTMSVAEMQSKVTQVALRLAHMTCDEDFSDFGNMRGWIEEHEVDEYCEEFEKGGEDDGK